MFALFSRLVLDFFPDSSKRSIVVLDCSQSGETKDVKRALDLAKKQGVETLSIVNVVGSLIARYTGMGVYLNAGREHAVASTKAFTSQVTVLALITLWFRQTREASDGIPHTKMSTDMIEALQRLPITFGMALRTHEHCKQYCF